MHAVVPIFPILITIIFINVLNLYYVFCQLVHGSKTHFKIISFVTYLFLSITYRLFLLCVTSSLVFWISWFGLPMCGMCSKRLHGTSNQPTRKSLLSVGRLQTFNNLSFFFPGSTVVFQLMTILVQESGLSVIFPTGFVFSASYLHVTFCRLF